MSQLHSNNWAKFFEQSIYLKAYEDRIVLKKGSPSKLNLDKRDDARIKTLRSKYTQPSDCSYSEQREVLPILVDLVPDFPIHCISINLMAKWKQETKTKASQAKESSSDNIFMMTLPHPLCKEANSILVWTPHSFLSIYHELSLDGDHGRLVEWKWQAKRILRMTRFGRTVRAIQLLKNS